MRIKKLLVKRWINYFGSMSGSKQFKGDQFERMEGLDYILNRCNSMSVLDIGSNNGLILYEFAKRGAKEVTGIEIDKRLVKFSNNLFQYVEMPHKFITWDLLVHPPPISKTDIVLFLGMFHHLCRQTEYTKNAISEERILEYVKFYLKNTGTYFVLSPSTNPQLNEVILKAGFIKVYSIKRKIEGTLVVYKRKNK